MNLTAWRAWRRDHYADGELRPHGARSPLLERLLATRSGARALRRAEQRYAEACRLTAADQDRPEEP